MNVDILLQSVNDKDTAIASKYRTSPNIVCGINFVIHNVFRTRISPILLQNVWYHWIYQINSTIFYNVKCKDVKVSSVSRQHKFENYFCSAIFIFEYWKLEIKSGYLDL